MQFGYTIVYVPDVAASLVLFEQALGLRRKFLQDRGQVVSYVRCPDGALVEL